MIDPLIGQLLALAFALLFAASAWHKLTDLARLRGVLAGFAIVPPVLELPVAWAISLVEAGLAIAWLLNLQTRFTALATAVLMAVYALAIGLNLLRGRVHIDCGCSIGSAKGSGQQLSWHLLLRNGVLVLAALVAALPTSSRELSLADFVGLVGGLVALAFLYAAGNQLIHNAQAINSWYRQSIGDGGR